MAKNLGLTVNELAALCQELIKEGKGQRHIVISNDEEGNNFHPLIYGFTYTTKNLKPCLDSMCNNDYTVNNAVALG